MAGRTVKIRALLVLAGIATIPNAWGHDECAHVVADAARLERSLGPFADPRVLSSADFSTLKPGTQLSVDRSAFAKYRHVPPENAETRNRVPVTFVRHLPESENTGRYGRSATAYLRLDDGKVLAVDCQRLHGAAWLRHERDVAPGRELRPDELLVLGNAARTTPLLLPAPFPYEFTVTIPPAYLPYPARPIATTADDVEILLREPQNAKSDAFVYAVANFEDIRRVPRSGLDLLNARLSLLEALPVSLEIGERVRYRLPRRQRIGGPLRIGELVEIDRGSCRVRGDDGKERWTPCGLVWKLPPGETTPFTPTLEGSLTPADRLHVFPIHQTDATFFRFLDGVARFTSQPHYRAATAEKRVRLLMDLLLAFVPSSVAALLLEVGGYETAGAVLLAGVAMCRHQIAMLRWMMAESGFETREFRSPIAYETGNGMRHWHAHLRTDLGNATFVVDPANHLVLPVVDLWRTPMPAELRENLTREPVREIRLRRR